MNKKIKIIVICATGALLLAVISTILIAHIKSQNSGAPKKGYTNPNAFTAGTDNSTTFTFEYRKCKSDGSSDAFLQSQGYIEHSDKKKKTRKTKWPASDDVLKQVEDLVTKYEAVSLFMQYSETPFEQTACADPDTYYFFSFSKEGKSYTFSIKQINLSLNQYSEVVKRIEAFFAELDQVLYNIPAYRDVVYVTDAME